MQDFNNIQQWLDPLLEKKGLTPERFARLCNLSRASIYFYRSDTSRPSEQSMIRMCQVLGVPASQGLSQYTPKKNGKPSGKSGGRS